MAIIQERLAKLPDISLKSGSHSPDSTFCVMECVAWVVGEKWSDAPICACPVISAFLRSWNDSLPNDAERDRLLKPLIPLLVGTRKKSLEKRRSFMAADWLIRVHTPAWLRLAGLEAQAKRIESLPRITRMAQYPSLRGPLEAVRDDARAAGDDAAWAATRAAARAAAWAAAGAAAWAAAGDDAAWAAAWAATRAAAWAAAWAAAGDAEGEKLAPTVARLQDSALELVHRMIKAK